MKWKLYRYNVGRLLLATGYWLLANDSLLPARSQLQEASSLNVKPLTYEPNILGNVYEL